MKSKEVTVIIPTYNEKENIEQKVKKICHHLKRESFEIVVVDDNSPDGTGKIVEKLQKEFPIQIVHRPARSGLSSAVIAGVKIAKGEIVGVMDADESHPPNIVPELIKVVKQGAKIAVASRYIPGGGIENWPLRRKIMSRIATFLARPLTKLKDPVSGYFFFKKEIVENVNLKPRGYKILLEILVKADINQFCEIPYKFIDRQRGKSKISSNVVWDYISQIIRLYFLKLRRFMEFCIVGLSGVLVNMFFLWFFTEVVGLHYMLSSPAAVELAIINNFTWNHIWTFRKSKNKSHVLTRFGKFNVISIIGLFVNLLVLYSLTEFLGLYYLFSNLFGIVSAVLWNYFLNVNWTWRE